MIKLKAGQGDNLRLLFGLSHENLRRLKKGQPIQIDLSELGLSGVCVIFAGKDEHTMAKEVRDQIGPNTTVLDVY